MKYIATALTALALSVPAQAEVRIYEFTATVNSLGNVNRLAYEQTAVGVRAGSLISLDDRIVGRFSYDNNSRLTSSSADWSHPYDPANSDYYYFGGASTPTNFLTFSILPSGQTVSSGGVDAPYLELSIIDGKVGAPNSFDRLRIAGGTRNTLDFGIVFSDRTSNWLSSGTLPQRLSLGDMPQAGVYHNFYNAQGHRIFLGGGLTSLTDVTVTPVPEPGTWVMLVAGLAILGVGSRRKRG